MIDYKNFKVSLVLESGAKKDLSIGLSANPASISVVYENAFERKQAIGESVILRSGDGKVKITLEYDVATSNHDFLANLFEVGTVKQRQFSHLKADRGYRVDAIREVFLTEATISETGSSKFIFEGEVAEEVISMKQASISKNIESN